MDLREHTVTLRLSTHQDLLAEGMFASVVDSFEALAGVPMAFSRDMGSAPRQRPGVPRAGRVVLAEMMGHGHHHAAKVRLTPTDRKDPPDAPWISIYAGPHPYSGTFRTEIDARVPTARFLEEGFTEAYVRWVEELCAVCRPYLGHAHDTDDISIQNTRKASLLRSGFGLDVLEDVDVHQNPGFEVSRGAFRLMACWLMIIGPELQELLELEDLEGVPFPSTEPSPGIHLVRLYDSPDQADQAASRNAQLTMREVLGFKAIANRDAWAWGYWDKKNRKI